MGRRNPPRRNHLTNEKPSQLRIIGGEWRGRKIPFTPLPGLRPTPDRVRETLFNWLQPYITGAHCLDLFSGSGALGFEALSRGAETVTFIDQEPSVVRQLRDNLQLLGCNRAEVIQDSVLNWLEHRIAGEEQRYDIIFMDPPFRQELAAPCCELLERQGLLAAEAVIYVETESELQGSITPPNWHPHRQKEAGQVRYQLFIREDQEPEA